MILADFPSILDSLWLKLGAVFIGIAVFGGMAYWEVRRRGRSLARQTVKAHKSDDPADKTRRMLLGGGQATNVSVWTAARDAVEAYADPELRQARENWSLRFRTASEKVAEAQRQIKEIRDRLPECLVPKEADVWPELEQAEGQQRLNAVVAMNTGEEVRQLSIDMHADVYKKLCLGTLLAKGFREPRVAESSEIQISPAEWRMLMLLHLDAKAVEKGIDGKLVYSGIVIGRP